MRPPLHVAWRSAAGLLIFFALWEGVAQSGLVSGLLLPAPSRVPAAFWSEIRLGIWTSMVSRSAIHYSAGLAFGSLLGISAGTAVSLWPGLDAGLAWVVRMLRPIPSIAWVPFAIIWFGVTETAAGFIIAITVFWLNFFATAAAVRSVDKDLIEMGQAFGQRRLFARLTKIILPASSPGILAGLRSGIGQRMMEASGLLATHVVVLYMVTIAALYGVSDALFMRLQRRVLAWQR
jgi:NitT/TauT family transport system permease protein